MRWFSRTRSHCSQQTARAGVQPAPGHPDGTLVNALALPLQRSCPASAGKRAGHRAQAGRDTSGLILCCINNFSHLSLAKQLSDRSLSLIYEAVVQGGSGSCGHGGCSHLGHPVDRKRMSVSRLAACPERPPRRHALGWIARYSGGTHLRCKLETGRTHQIRVHMAHI